MSLFSYFQTSSMIRKIKPTFQNLAKSEQNSSVLKDILYIHCNLKNYNIAISIIARL